MLKNTVDSLRPQGSVLVILNNYNHIPDFLQDGEYLIRYNDMGDAERYYGIEEHKGYLFTCDDDLIYPPDYVDYMIKAVDKYNCVCTLHGKTYPVPFISFNHTLNKYRCLDDVTGDGRVDLGGTGVMAWHSDFLKVRYEDFKSKNMADVWFGKICKEQGVKVMCLAHRRGNLIHQNPERTIWMEEKEKGFVEQTKIMKTYM